MYSSQSVRGTPSNSGAAFSTRPWLFWWPGLFIVIICLSINFIGDGLRDALAHADTSGTQGCHRCRVREHQELVFISTGGMVQRTGVRGISQYGRLSQGVRVLGASSIGALRAAELSPLFVSTMCGYDAWSWAQNVDFFGRLFGQIPAVKSGARVSLVDKTDALTRSAPSPLALRHSAASGWA